MEKASSENGSLLVTAALAYAERGWPVFPLRPRGKLPLTENGYLAATTDRDQIRGWWRDHPQANIGLATGRASGIWVLDIDQHNADGDKSLAELEHRFGTLPPTLTQDTPSGGNHRIFLMNGSDVRNRANVAPGLDVRGTGGYIVAPPSIHPNGKPYRWRQGSSPDEIGATEAPAWLKDLVEKRHEPPMATNDRTAPPERYASAAFGAIIGELSGAREGERNDALNRAAFSLGQLIGANAISRGQCESVLKSVAASLGLPAREAEATIRSGIAAGIQEPRQIPEARRKESRNAPRSQPQTIGSFDPETGEIIPPSNDNARPPLTFEWFSDVQPSLETLDFVEGVLTQSAFSVVYGEPGCGKTFFVLDLALHVALGRRWFDRETSQGGVVYVALEGVRGLRNRIVALRQHYGLEDATVPLAVVTSAINLLDPEADTPRLIEAILAAIQTIEGPVWLVVIDTLSRALSGGDENSPEDMGALVNNAQAVIAATGAHMLFIHHSGKDKTRGARGHSVLLGNIDTEIEIVRDEVTKVATAKSRKQRDLDLFDDFSFELRTVELGVNGRGKPVTSCYVALADTPESDPGEQMKESEQVAFDEIGELLARDGRQNVTPEDGMPPVVAVTKDQLRRWFVQRGILSLDGKGNIDTRSRSRFNRALESLIAKRRIRVHGDWIWIV